MTSRERILNEIKTSGIEPIPISRPVWKEMIASMEQFQNSVRSIGGVVSIIQSLDEVHQFIVSKGDALCVHNIDGITPNISSFIDSTPQELEPVHNVLLSGSIAVAENGAIYIAEASMGNRLLPFICQQLIIVIQEKNIVADMHEAYRRIGTMHEGYGVFIAGPSKTADIEQSLVIGAHGPLELQVFILTEP